MSGKSNQTNIQKRKRLDALFQRGGEVRFHEDTNGVNTGEPHDDDLVIWVCPASPLQREMAIREAQAARSRVMLEARRDENAPAYTQARSFLANLDLDGLIDYVLDIEEPDRLARARRDVLAEKEWEDFNQLRDAMRQFEEAGSPVDDPEWKPLLERDAAFGDAVYERANTIREGDREGLTLMNREVLEKRALDKRIDQAGSSTFMKVYEEWMLYYGCRDGDDHSTLFFSDLDDLKSTSDEVQDALSKKLVEFITDPAEAKNLQAAGSGSASSEPPSEPETSPASSPEESIGF